MSRPFDFIVVGSGIAGLSFVLKAAAHGRVALITKKNRAESNTNYAQGGIASVMSEQDSVDLHVRDTLDAGAGLCDEAAVRMCVEEGPSRIRELVDLGVRFSERDGVAPAEYDLGREGGHSRRRVLHAADMTGKEVERALLSAVEENENIEVFENCFAIDLILSNRVGLPGGRRCVGLYALNNETGGVETFSAPVVVLATGGCSKCYLYTTNPDIATGDGVAMAFRAGVPVANMEFIQFHPTCLFHPFSRSFLISEALRGEGAKLIDAKGRDFMGKYSAQGALAPRDIVARAIDAEMKKSGSACVYLDITAKSPDYLRSRFPNIYEHCLSLGIDAAKDPIPVVPAAHYQCGGVITNMDGETALPGLLAIGEVAFTGLHGANRLASNSLLEALVMAHRGAARAVEALGRGRDDAALPEWEEGEAHDPDEMVVVTHNWKELRQIMWDYVGIVRTNKRLERARNRLTILNREIQEYYWNFKVTTDLLELRNLVTASALIVESAMRRRESRGLHYTLDYPKVSDELCNTVVDHIPWL